MNLQEHTQSLFLSCLVVSRVIEKGKVALDQPGKGVTLWTMTHNCPFSSGQQARAGRENFLPECLLLAKGEMKCHTNYLGSGQCKENWLQLWEAAARSPITEWGWAGFYAAGPALGCDCTQETPAHSGCGCSTLRLWAFPGGGPGHWGLNQLFLSKHKDILVAFRTNPREGGEFLCLQLISGQWCLGAQKAVCCFSVVLVVGGKKCNSVHQECLNKRGTSANYFSAKLGLAKSATECEI